MFKDLYTNKEVELNKKLFNECIKEVVDFALVESLLKQGADPLGPTSLEEFDITEHIYGEIILDFCYNEGKNLPEITKIFLKHGMDISNPRVPYDSGNSSNPLWDFAFLANEYSAKTLKILLDSKIAYENIAEFWKHAVFDMVYVADVDPNDPTCKEDVVWTMKMIMLCASYPHIINEDSDLREFICYELNDYDVSLFRAWDEYEYKFDTTFCETTPSLRNSIAKIYEKESKKEVWRICIS